jgi:hypothetical protein
MEIVKAHAQRAQVGAEIGRMYIAYQKEFGHPPSGLHDLVPFRAHGPRGFQAIEDGEWIVLWNTRLSQNPRGNDERILCYEKRLRDGEGIVSFAGGYNAPSMSLTQYSRMTEETSALDEIGQMYLLFSKAHGRAPSSLADLRQYQTRFPKGIEWITDRDTVITWGMQISDDPGERYDRVLASATKFNSSARWILTADGSYLSMVPKEFREWQDATPILHEIVRMYRDYCTSHEKAPSRLEEVLSIVVDEDFFRRRFP